MAEAQHPRRKSTAATLDQRLHLVRTCGAAKLMELCRDHFGADYARLPTSYIDSLCIERIQKLVKVFFERFTVNCILCEKE